MRLSWPWWPRRTPGRHELGAAVTAIASGVVRTGSLPHAAIPPYAAPAAAAAIPSPAAPAAAAVIPSPAAPAAAAAIRPYAAPAAAVMGPAAVAPADVARAARPMVSLGFRDGSTETLDPASSQARALQQLASSLTATD